MSVRFHLEYTDSMFRRPPCRILNVVLVLSLMSRSMPAAPFSGACSADFVRLSPVARNPFSDQAFAAVDQLFIHVVNRHRVADYKAATAKPAGSMVDGDKLTRFTEEWYEQGLLRTCLSPFVPLKIEHQLQQIVDQSIFSEYPEIQQAWVRSILSLRSGRLHHLAVEIAGVSGKASEFLIAADLGSRQPELRVISRLLREGEQGVKKETLRIFAPLSALKNLIEGRRDPPLAEAIWHEIAEQDPFGPLKHWIIAAWELILFKPNWTVFLKTRLPPRFAWDLRRAIDRRDTPYLSNLLQEYNKNDWDLNFGEHLTWYRLAQSKSGLFTAEARSALESITVQLYARQLWGGLSAPGHPYELYGKALNYFQDQPENFTFTAKELALFLKARPSAAAHLVRRLMKHRIIDIISLATTKNPARYEVVRKMLIAA
jgi:hypothetical protein